ncbi:MAG: lipopolysaccharide biosynthesis protein [Bacteroidales bacterium]|nr:lipopolysaccharide biosynthesis protein [Bacteroidales bacterium]
MVESLRKKTFKGTIWSTLERFSTQGVAFVVMIIMARILTPEDYGLVGMLTIFIAISQSLIDSGFSQALIRKQDRKEIDNSTVFYFNIAVGLILYIILFLCAPLIARFYNEPLLIPLTRVISLSVIINSFVVVQRALLTTELNFKTQAKASLSAAVISGIVGIVMAYSGYGVWAIVWYQITNLFVNVGLLWIFSKWRPQITYSWKSFRELFGFGSKLAISGIIDTLYNNIYLIVIGKVFKASDLGYYTRAQQFASFPSSNITGIIQRVTFPVLCTIQDDDDRLRIVYRKFLRLSAFVIFPLMIGLAVLAKPLILILLKEQWAFAATLLSIICFQLMWYPIHAINLNLLQVKGRSDLFLKLEIWKKCIGVIVLCITLPVGLVAMCIGGIFTSIICLIINTHYSGKLIHVGFITQIRDLFPSLIYSLTMGIIIYVLIRLFTKEYIQLITGLFAGVIYYFFITKVTKSNDLKELLAFIRTRK